MPKIPKMVFLKIYFAIISIILFSTITSMTYIFQQGLAGEESYHFLILFGLRAIYVSGVYFLYAIPISMAIDLLIKNKIVRFVAYVIAGAFAGLGYYIILHNLQYFLLFEALFFASLGITASIVFWCVEEFFKWYSKKRSLKAS